MRNFIYSTRKRPLPINQIDEEDWVGSDSHSTKVFTVSSEKAKSILAATAY